MGTRTLWGIVILGALVAALACSVFTVSESELAVRTNFGRIVGTDYPPGLHFKWPVDEVVKLDRRILSQAYTGETFLTNDNRGLIVDFYVKWRVKDAAEYYKVTGGREDVAGLRIAEILKDGIKGVVAQQLLEQIVSSERAGVTGEMFAQAREQVAALGVDLIDVRVQRIDLPEEVASQVYASMKEGFRKTANGLRGKGQQLAAIQKAQADRERIEILAAAQSEALRMRGEADAKAAGIYAAAYSKNPEFYAFYRALQAYKASLGKEGDLLLLSPDGEFFKYFKEPDHPPAAK
jgi:modulator of FtsH protease HflC